MTAITSGTYGHQPIFSGATIRRLAVALFSSHPEAATTSSARAAQAWPLPWPSASLPSFSAGSGVRVREAEDVRELARSVEAHSPGFAADLYAAAWRHEGYDD